MVKPPAAIARRGPVWCYRLYGLNVHSALELRGLQPATGVDSERRVAPGDSGTVTLEWGEVPASLPGAVERGSWYESAPGTLLFTDSPTGRFLVTGGNRIVLEGGYSSNRWQLLRPAFGALLQQRGTLAIHAAMVSMPGGAVGLVGHSRAGKSTLAAFLGQRGHALLNDDLCAVSLEKKAVWAEPGSERLRLWDDAFMALGLARGQRIVDGYDKFEAAGAEPAKDRARLRALIRLEVGDAPSVAALGIGERMALCLRHTHYREYLAGMGCRESNFAACATVARRVPALRLTRPLHFSAMEETARLLEDAIGCLSG